MGSRILYTQVKTHKPVGEIKNALRRAFSSLGGKIDHSPTGIVISQGKEGVKFAVGADFSASIDVREIRETQYEIECAITWKMNFLNLMCLAVGVFFFGILWIVPLLYLFINPEPQYQQSLNRIQAFIE